MRGEIARRGEERGEGGGEVRVIVVTVATVRGVGVAVGGGMVEEVGDEKGARGRNAGTFAVEVARLRRVVCMLSCGMLRWPLKFKV